MAGCKRLEGSYLQHDQLVQERSPPHVGEGDEAEDDEGADHVALRPGLENEAIRIRRLVDLASDEETLLRG